MNDFCFVVVSFNQGKYVYEHLESIKYLIEQYGKGKKIQIVFSDDASQDDTVIRAKKWIEKNSNLFNESTVIEHSTNVGTIQNMKDAISHVNAIAYKEMACDDLFFTNNIFDIYRKGNLVLTPTIAFYDDYSTDIGDIKEYIVFLKYRNKNINKVIKDKLSYYQCIASPGVFISRILWDDRGFQQFISQYKYIEDIPEWYYLFNLYKGKLNTYVDTIPYIMYRCDVGVTKLIKKEDNPIEAEYKRIRKDIIAKQEILPKYINPYAYGHTIKYKLRSKLWAHRKDIKSILNKLESSRTAAAEHLQYIKNMADKCDRELK